MWGLVTWGSPHYNPVIIRLTRGEMGGVCLRRVSGSIGLYLGTRGSGGINPG